jgi:hypothetical protein
MVFIHITLILFKNLYNTYRKCIIKKNNASMAGLWILGISGTN